MMFVGVPDRVVELFRYVFSFYFLEMSSNSSDVPAVPWKSHTRWLVSCVLMEGACWSFLSRAVQSKLRKVALHTVCHYTVERVTTGCDDSWEARSLWRAARCRTHLCLGKLLGHGGSSMGCSALLWPVSESLGWTTLALTSCGCFHGFY